MKDLLLFVPIDEFALAQYEFIPIGLVSIASYMEQFGFSVDILHGLYKDIPAGYKYYGVSTTTNQYPIAQQALRFIKQMEPKAKTMLGGAHLNAEQCQKECLLDDWDFLVVGEGEQAVLDILSGQIKDRLIQGTLFTDLNVLPLLNYSKLDIRKYNFPLQEGLHCINVMTSRGCPYRCAFCSTAGTKLRQFSAEKVCADLKHLNTIYGFDSFMFVDDTISVNRKRYREILAQLKSLNIKWRSYGRVNALNEEDLILMKESGCLEVALGIESGSQKLLDLIRKGTSAKRNLEFVKLCKKIGIKANCMIIIGLPNESRETIQETEQWIREAQPECFGYNILFPFPDSPLIKEYSFFKDFITIYPYDWQEAATKAKSIDRSFVSTPFLSREEILSEYKRNFDLFVSITKFDPRNRKNRKAC